eukprot:TRINITY_DN617_c0_g1_i1.p1 TRINITY_DN617_c0_g1~~TRINITY_DN617_c0_g1_i1.p1  ORF type:complete len:176 (+),score=27.95 TRINITY_DN617_c0_g1_i1:404-931(+)
MPQPLYEPFLDEDEEKEFTVIYDGQPACCLGPMCSNTRWKLSTLLIEKRSGYGEQTVDKCMLEDVKDIRYAEAGCLWNSIAGCCGMLGCCFGLCGGGGCCNRSNVGSISIYTTDNVTPRMVISGIDDAFNVYKGLRDAITAIHSRPSMPRDQPQQQLGVEEYEEPETSRSFGLAS